jgi:hypothetical protein
VQSVHLESRAEVDVGELPVAGTVPGTRRPRSGLSAIIGDVDRLSRGRARELSAALQLVFERTCTTADGRYGALDLVTPGRAER